MFITMLITSETQQLAKEQPVEIHLIVQRKYLVNHF